MRSQSAEYYTNVVRIGLLGKSLQGINPQLRQLLNSLRRGPQIVII